MVWLGVMDAPGGLFEPVKPITQGEAALIMYYVAELADPDYFDYGFDDEDILLFLKEFKVHDEDGPNAFDPGENLTNRLALVRLSRFFDVVFE